MSEGVLSRGSVPLIALAGLGLAMMALLAAAPWIIEKGGFATLIPAIVASGGITMGACWIARRGPQKAALVVIGLLAALMRIVVMFQEPSLSTDIYRYVWDGRVQAAGVNPYRYVPADPALAALRDTAIYPNINRADYAVTAYPPIAQMFFLAVTRISETVTAMRLAMVGCEIAILAVMLSLLRRVHRPATDIVAWAWHPLVIWEIAHSGHVEALMVALLMLGVWLLARTQALSGAVAVALAALVKPYALVALPSFWRKWDWRMPVVAAATIGLCYLPYLGVGRGVLGFVTSGYLTEEGLSGGQGFWLVALLQAILGDLPALTLVYIGAGLGVLALLALQAATRDGEDLQATLTGLTLLLMAGIFLISPNYPWYLLCIVPFIALSGQPLSLPAWAFTVAAPFLYRPVVVPYHDIVWKTAANLPFVIAVCAVIVRRRSARISVGAAQWTK